MTQDDTIAKITTYERTYRSTRSPDSRKPYESNKDFEEILEEIYGRADAYLRQPSQESLRAWQEAEKKAGVQRDVRRDGPPAIERADHLHGDDDWWEYPACP